MKIWCQLISITVEIHVKYCTGIKDGQLIRMIISASRTSLERLPYFFRDNTLYLEVPLCLRPGGNDMSVNEALLIQSGCCGER